MKGSKHQIQEMFDIKEYISKIKHQLCYEQIIRIKGWNIESDYEVILMGL